VSEQPLPEAGQSRWLTPRWAALLLLIIILPLPWTSSDVRLGLSNGVFDIYQRLYPRKLERLPVAIVNIDEASLKAIGQWPWPRTELAKLIEMAAAEGALAIGLDILMPEADRFSPSQLVARHPGLDAETRGRLAALPNNDDLLAMRIFALPVAVGRAGLNGAGAAKPTDPTTVRIKGPPPDNLLRFDGHLPNVESIDAAAQGHGFLNSDPSRDGAIRSVPAVIGIGDEIYPSLAVEMLRLAVRQQTVTLASGVGGVRGLHVGQSFLPLDADGKIRLHFSHTERKRWISALDLLQGKLDTNIFANKLVLIGATGLGLRDAPPTPVSKRMDGVEIQAQIIENLLAGSRLLRPGWTTRAEIALLLFLGGILILAGRDAPPWRLIVLYAVPAVVTVVTTFVMFTQSRLLLDPSPALLGSTLMAAFLLTAGFAHANRRRRALNRALELEKLETARMSGELGAAREIQMGILPDPKNIAGRPENIDFFALLEPAREVGGDLYDAFMVDDNRFFFVIGDVSGKGVGASLFMALSKALCKSAALRGETDLARIVGLASAEIARENPAMLFVAAVAGILNTETGLLQFCVAGHDAPILKSRDGSIRPLDSKGGPPFCVIEDFPYPIEEVQLDPGDLLVMFTDGVTEAQGADNIQFGLERVNAYLAQSERDADTEMVCGGLRDAVQVFTGGQPPFDDMAIIAVQYLEKTPRQVPPSEPPDR
jgi:adenylate cyclase